MATIMNDAAYMGFPLSIKRGNPAPVDTTAVWYNKTELETYAASGATAYVGQILTLVADNKCEAYMISNEAGTLVKLAQTTASGDLAHDVATLQGQVANLISKVGNAAEGETVPATGLYALIDEVKALAEGKVSSVGAADRSVTIGGTATAPTVGVAISADKGNALSLASDGLKVTIPEITIPEYSLKKLDTATTGMSASYQLTKDGTGIGAVIDIPKDMMVKSGSVQTYETGSLPAGVTEAGTYIVLVLNDTAETKLYINVGNLIEYVTSGSANGDMVFVNIDPQTHKVTATITDGTVTEAKLHADVKAKLAKAVSAVQSVTEGTENGKILVDGTAVAVHGLQDAAYATVASLNETAQNKVNTAKGELLGDENDDNTKETIRGARKLAESSATSALADAKTYVGEEIGKLNADDTAVAKQFVSAVSEASGKITVERRALLAEDVPELGISKISGLQAAIDAKQDTVSFDGAYSASNKAATVSTVNSAVAAIVSDGKDEAADDTIKGAKKYADEKASAALSSAKEYADSIVTGTGGITSRVETLEGKVDVAKVSTAIATAKNEAIAAAEEKDTALKTVILGTGHTGTVKDAAAAAKAADDKAVAAQTAVDTLSNKVGTIADGKTAAGLIGENATAISGINSKIGAVTEGKTVVQMIADAQTAATYDDTEVRGLITANKTAIDTLIGNATEDKNKSARTMAQEEVAKIVDNAPESFNTLKEIASWISDHDADVITMNNSIKANTDAITKLNGDASTTGSVAKAVKDGVTPVANRVTAIENKVTDDKVAKWDAAQANKIESIKVGDTALTIGEDKSVALPAATAAALGLVKVDGTSIESKNGVIGVKAVNVSTLYVADGDELVLNGGNA